MHGSEAALRRCRSLQTRAVSGTKKQIERVATVGDRTAPASAMGRAPAMLGFSWNDLSLLEPTEVAAGPGGGRELDGGSGL
jgi:hypothetical protein